MVVRGSTKREPPGKGPQKEPLFGLKYTLLVAILPYWDGGPYSGALGNHCSLLITRTKLDILLDQLHIQP